MTALRLAYGPLMQQGGSGWGFLARYLADQPSTLTLTGTDVDEWDNFANPGTHKLVDVGDKPNRTVTINSVDALDFEGTDECLSVADFARVNGAFSVAVVVQPDVVTGPSVFLGESDDAPSDHFWNFQCDGGDYYFVMRDASGDYFYNLGFAVPGVPVILQATWNGSTLNLYRNGAFVTTDDWAVATGFTVTSFEVGGSRFLGSVSNDFNGRIGQVEVADRALTAEEVAQQFEDLSRWGVTFTTVLATGGTVTTETPTLGVHEFTAGGTFALINPGILNVTATISATGTFGGLSASGSFDMYADQTVTVTSGTVEVAYNPSKFVEVGGLEAWYDASDELTISDTAGAVTAWSDKSGNSLGLTAAGGSEPTTGASTKNARNVIDFDGTEWMDAATAADWTFLHDGTDHTWVIVMKPGIVANPDVRYRFIGTSTTTARGESFDWDDRSSASANERINHLVTNGTAAIVQNLGTNGTMPANTWSALMARSDPNNGTASARSVMQVNNGTEQTGNALSGSVSASAPAAALRVGSVPTSTDELVGSIAEIMIFTSLLTSLERSALDSYLAAKWAI